MSSSSKNKPRDLRIHGSPAAPLFERLEGRTLLAGGGLAGAYYARTNHTLVKFSQTDPFIDFTWAGGTPAKSLGTDGFSVRWSGQIEPKFSETTSFILRNSGGVRLWVGNTLVIDDWAQHALREDRGQLYLLGGQKYDIRIDYWSDGSSPVLKLEWESARRARELVPTSRMHGSALDAVAPLAPTRLRGTYASYNVIKIAWDAADPAEVLAYDVYLGSTKVVTTAPGENFYIRRSLSADTGYAFSVRAIDAAGNQSAASQTAVTTAPPPNFAPTAPTGVSITGKTDTSISLSWTAAADDRGISGYRIYRNGLKLNVAILGTSFTDTGLSASTSYSYTIRAVDTDGAFSGYSDSAVGTTNAPVERNPYNGISAASYNDSSGVSKSGSDVVNADDGDWVRYRNVNFGSGAGANSIDLSLALPSSNRGGWIEIRLGGVNGTLVGRHAVQVTGSFGTYRSQRVNVSNVTGTHDLYLVFKGRSGVGNLRAITFSSRRLTRIMPLGDSITHQSSSSESYRYFLWRQLSDAGFDVDFVGGQMGSYVGEPPNYDFDQNHEGHANWTADEIAGSVAGWASTNYPDIVLLHAGTNDLRRGQGVDNALEDLGRIIDNLRSVNPNVKILLAQIIPSVGYEDQIDQLNALLPNLVAQKSSGQSPIYLVDQNTGFSLSDTYDGIHPNSSGDSKLAQRWFDTLDDIL